MHTHCFLLLLAFLALILGGCCAPPSGGKPNPGSAPGAAPAAPSDEPATPVDIKTLLSDYKGNEVRADGLYKGKRVQITGKVGSIKKGIGDQIYVTLGTGAQLEIPHVQCFFDSAYAAKTSALSKDQSLTVKGRVGGLMMNVLVKDCEF